MVWPSTCSYFIANFIKGKFGTKTEKAKNNGAKEEPVKIIEIQDAVVKEGKAEVIKELSNKLDSIEQKDDEVYEKVKKIQKDNKEEKRKINYIEILSSINIS